MDGTSTVTIVEPDTLTVSPLEMETESVEVSNFNDDEQHRHEVDQLRKEHFRYSICIICHGTAFLFQIQI